MPSTASQVSVSLTNSQSATEVDRDAPSEQNKYDIIKERRQRLLLEPSQLEPVTVTIPPSPDHDDQKKEDTEGVGGMKKFTVDSGDTNNRNPNESQSNTIRVGRYAYRQGVSSRLTASLQNLLRDTGMDETFRVLLTQNSLEPNESLCIVATDGDNDGDDDNKTTSEWNIQRPRSHWSNNMHWIAPSDENAQRMYMDALERGEFDTMLTEIAREFGGLMDMDREDNDDSDGTKRQRHHDWSIHHAFFIGVSHAEQSYTHCDFEDTDGKGFTMLIPLRLVGDHDNDENISATHNSNAKPELGFQNDDREWYAWYKYRYGEAALVGDGTWHVTADCDYRDCGKGDYRICANIYICRDDHPIHATINTKGVYT